jgi:hypothetical protein
LILISRDFWMLSLPTLPLSRWIRLIYFHNHSLLTISVDGRDFHRDERISLLICFCLSCFECSLTPELWILPQLTIQCHEISLLFTKVVYIHNRDFKIASL